MHVLGIRNSGIRRNVTRAQQCGSRFWKFCACPSNACPSNACPSNATAEKSAPRGTMHFSSPQRNRMCPRNSLHHAPDSRGACIPGACPRRCVPVNAPGKCLGERECVRCLSRECVPGMGRIMTRQREFWEVSEQKRVLKCKVQAPIAST